MSGSKNYPYRESAHKEEMSFVIKGIDQVYISNYQKLTSDVISALLNISKNISTYSVFPLFNGFIFSGQKNSFSVFLKEEKLFHRYEQTNGHFVNSISSAHLWLDFISKVNLEQIKVISQHANCSL